MPGPTGARFVDLLLQRCHLGELSMTKQVPKKAITDLVAQVMRIQKKYAHEQVGVRNDRRTEVKKIINRVASELENKDGN
jgi:low affinity Fe/Cu permease